MQMGWKAWGWQVPSWTPPLPGTSDGSAFGRAEVGSQRILCRHFVTPSYPHEYVDECVLEFPVIRVVSKRDNEVMYI